MTIRKAAAPDIPAVAALEAEEFPDGASEDMLRRLSESADGCILIAENAGEVLGYVWCRFVLDEGDIGNVAVKKEERRRGIAGELLRALDRECEERRIAVLMLEVRESNAAALALYEKNGFLSVGRRKKYYEKPTEDAILMSKFYTKEAQ